MVADMVLLMDEVDFSGVSCSNSGNKLQTHVHISQLDQLKVMVLTSKSNCFWCFSLFRLTNHEDK